jgi:hypothetical protein
MLGYPINYTALKRFSGDTNKILRQEAEEVNRQYPEIKPFIWNSKTQRYVQKAAPLRAWIEAQNHPHWLRTDKGALSLSLDAWEQFYDSNSPSLGGAMRKYLRTKQSLNGFLPRGVGSKRRSFWEFVGDDHRVRPYFGIYGAQSARSQPAATGFLPLKANWMRAFIQPPKGRAIVGIDYGSQEVLISALLSEDGEMIKAYESGDPYMYFAKLDGAIPWDGTKEGYANERSIYKTVTLGISYLMGARSLAFKLTGNHIEDYFDAGSFAKVKLPCGWYMWADNPNRKSVGNVPIQGFGSSIMRKAVALAQDRGLNVIYTLHDAIYVEYDTNDKTAVDKLKMSMDEGFRYYFPDHLKNRASCRLDVFAWSQDFEAPNNIYVDKKGENDYLKYREYFV